MEIDIKGGTAKHGCDLCRSCKHGITIEDVAGKQSRYCNKLNRFGEAVRLRRPIVRCSEYYAKTEPWEHEYQQIAWLITPDVKSGKIGFRRIQDMTDDEKQRHNVL